MRVKLDEYPTAKMEGPLSVFGDRSTGEAIRSQNGKGERDLGRAHGGAGPLPARAAAAGSAPSFSLPREGPGSDRAGLAISRRGGCVWLAADAQALELEKRSWAWRVRSSSDTCRSRLESPLVRMP